MLFCIYVLLGCRVSNVTATESVRIMLREFDSKRTFTVYDFPNIRGISAVLYGLWTNAEIIVVDSFQRSTGGKPVRRYMVSNLHGTSENGCHDGAWKDVYPEFYTPPDFSGYSSTTRGFKIGI